MKKEDLALRVYIEAPQTHIHTQKYTSENKSIAHRSKLTIFNKWLNVYGHN